MKFVFTAVASALLLSATPAMAADGTGFYVGAGFGSMGVDVGDFSGDDTSFKILGGWDFNQFIGGELEYIDARVSRGLRRQYRCDRLQRFLEGRLSFTEQFSVFGKIGMIFWDADLDDGEFSASESGEDFSWGVGAGYDFTDNFGGRARVPGLRNRGQRHGRPDFGQRRLQVLIPHQQAATSPPPAGSFLLQAHQGTHQCVRRSLH